MDSARRLIDALRALDQQGRISVSEAASAGRFDEVVALTPMASEISSLLARWESSLRGADTGHELAEPPATARRASKRKALRKVTSLVQYPRFVRDKDDLVKIGWSPREDGPYEHRVPKPALDQVVVAISRVGKTGHRFSMDELISSVRSLSTKQAIPSYQIYAGVLWLKWSGILLQHGRQGYTIVRPQTFNDSVDTAWQALPQRQ